MFSAAVDTAWCSDVFEGGNLRVAFTGSHLGSAGRKLCALDRSHRLDAVCPGPPCLVHSAVTVLCADHCRGENLAGLPVPADVRLEVFHLT